MPVSVLTPIRSEGSSLELKEIVWTVLDLDGAEFPMSGNDVFLVENTDITNPVTVVVKSAPNALARTGDVSQAIPALGIRILGPFTQLPGWSQSGGSMVITVSVTSLARVAVIRQPA